MKSRLLTCGAAGTESPKEEQRWLTTALAEYAAIRGEIVAALAAQHAVFSYGVAAVGLLTAVAVGATSGGPDESGSADKLAALILLGLNPVLLVAVLFLWTTEVLRMQRAGAYLFALESVINKKSGHPLPLAWEGVVNPPRDSDGKADRIFPHVDQMQRVAISIALTTITAGSVVSGLTLDPAAVGDRRARNSCHGVLGPTRVGILRRQPTVAPRALRQDSRTGRC